MDEKSFCIKMEMVAVEFKLAQLCKRNRACVKLREGGALS
jgi:hypothetical protein